MTTQLSTVMSGAITTGLATSHAVPALIAVAGERASPRFLEFFGGTIRNPHTRRAYGRAVADFLAWCEDAGVPSIAAVQPLHVATWIEMQTRKLAAASVKQQLAAIKHLFDWLVTGQIVPINPAASVRGPSHIVRQGKTPVLEPAEARALLDSIDATTPAGLRDRALIALMVFSFARVGAALAMKVEDVFVQNRRLWVRLREKGGKAHAMPCHHSLEEYLTTYLEQTGIIKDEKGPLFRTVGRGTSKLTVTPLPQANAYQMIARRAAAAGIMTNHPRPAPRPAKRPRGRPRHQKLFPAPPFPAALLPPAGPRAQHQRCRRTHPGRAVARRPRRAPRAGGRGGPRPRLPA